MYIVLLPELKPWSLCKFNETPKRHRISSIMLFPNVLANTLRFGETITHRLSIVLLGSDPTMSIPNLTMGKPLWCSYHHGIYHYDVLRFFRAFSSLDPYISDMLSLSVYHFRNSVPSTMVNLSNWNNKDNGSFWFRTHSISVLMLSPSHCSLWISIADYPPISPNVQLWWTFYQP